MRQALILLFVLAMAGAEAKTWRNHVSWPEYAEEAVKVFIARGGDADMALYAEYDFDNDGREELVIYEPKPYEDPNRHVCIFCVNQKNEMQFVVDAPLPLFTYNMQGQGSYVFTTDGKCVQLANSTSQLDTKGEYGDGDGKDGYYRIVDNEIENWTADCDNMLFMEDNSTGYWIHRSCVAVMSRHNDGAPLKLLKDWDDCDPQPVVHTITKPTILRPISYSELEGWVKVQTLDGKHTGWVTKDKLGPVRNHM